MNDEIAEQILQQLKIIGAALGDLGGDGPSEWMGLVQTAFGALLGFLLAFVAGIVERSRQEKLRLISRRDERRESAVAASNAVMTTIAVGPNALWVSALEQSAPLSAAQAVAWAGTRDVEDEKVMAWVLLAQDAVVRFRSDLINGVVADTTENREVPAGLATLQWRVLNDWLDGKKHTEWFVQNFSTREGWPSFTPAPQSSTAG